MLRERRAEAKVNAVVRARFRDRLDRVFENHLLPDLGGSTRRVGKWLLLLAVRAEGGNEDDRDTEEQDGSLRWHLQTKRTQPEPDVQLIRCHEELLNGRDAIHDGGDFFLMCRLAFTTKDNKDTFLLGYLHTGQD